MSNIFPANGLDDDERLELAEQLPRMAVGFRIGLLSSIGGLSYAG
jgi:hypothetical protein